MLSVFYNALCYRGVPRVSEQVKSALRAPCFARVPS